MQNERVIFASEACRFYTREGIPVLGVPYADKKRQGELRDPTIKDCKKLRAIPSVTEYLRLVNKPGLNAWKLDTLLDCVLEWCSARKDASQTIIEGMSESSTWKRDILSLFEAKESLTTDRGILIHAELERFFQQGREPGSPVCLRATQKIVAHYQLPTNVSEMLKVVSSEQTFANTKLGYAGTTDFRLGDRKLVADFKSRERITEKTRTYPEQGMQLAAYGAHWFGLDNDAQHDNIFVCAETGDIHVVTWTKEDITRLFLAFTFLVSVWRMLNQYDPRD
jgi:hypothetical protein